MDDGVHISPAGTMLVANEVRRTVKAMSRPCGGVVWGTLPAGRLSGSYLLPIVFTHDGICARYAPGKYAFSFSSCDAQECAHDRSDSAALLCGAAHERLCIGCQDGSV